MNALFPYGTYKGVALDMVPTGHLDSIHYYTKSPSALSAVEAEKARRSSRYLFQAADDETVQQKFLTHDYICWLLGKHLSEYGFIAGEEVTLRVSGSRRYIRFDILAVNTTSGANGYPIVFEVKATRPDLQKSLKSGQLELYASMCETYLCISHPWVADGLAIPNDVGIILVTDDGLKRLIHAPRRDWSRTSLTARAKQIIPRSAQRSWRPAA